MRQTTFKLKAITVFLAGLLFAVSILISSHAHAEGTPEKSDTCATCHLLPQGLKFVSDSPSIQIPLETFVSEIFLPSSPSEKSAEIFSGLIRGPPNRA
ncbi:MAG: hypothetical protein K8R69_11585 [Deltaproteobacteria bacterium]|nr:hypothetical protein [Deltaproteobacteria bacterium]